MSNDFKIIMESWNSYVNLIESNVDTNIYPMNEGKFKKSSFSLLLEQADQGIISLHHLKSLNHSSHILII